MKKILTSFLTVILLMVYFMVPVLAETENSIEDYMTDIQYVDPIDGANESYTFYSPDDENYYLVNVYDHKIEVFDLDTQQLLTRAYIIQGDRESAPVPPEITSDMFMSPMRVGPDDYEKWFNFTYAWTDQLYIDDAQVESVSIIISLICQFMGIPSVVSDLAEGILDLGTTIYNYQYRNLYAKVYLSNNVYCTILAKERYDFYLDSNDVFVGSTQRIRWYGQAIDPMSPYACQILDQRY